jgi:hypothetical protein
VKLNDDLIEYRLEILPEDMPVRGNAMSSGDAAFDKKVEDDILESLDSGNEWAWCTVKVTARLKGTEVAGWDFLGGCSYESEAEFKTPGGYYDDMMSEAKADLIKKLENILSKIGVTHD